MAGTHEHMSHHERDVFAHRLMLAACGDGSRDNAPVFAATYAEIPDCTVCRFRVTLSLARFGAAALEYTRGAEGGERWLMAWLEEALDNPRACA